MFDLRTVNKRSRGYQPHWEIESGRYHVIFRVWDSLPADVVERIRNKQRVDAARLVSRGVPQVAAEAHAAVIANQKLDRYLDRGVGSCPLKNPKVAELVGNAIEHFDGDRYWLFDWSLMPNHVHVVFEAVDRLDAIVHSWKSFSGLRANEILGRKGPFWQKEPWDRLIRDDADLIRTVRYVASNPERAGMRDWKWTKVYEERLPAVSVL